MRYAGRLLLLVAVAVVLAILLLPRFAHAGPVGGQKWNEDTVLANDSDVYRVRFEANEPARVLIAGDGDLDLFIYDQGGHLIDQDTRAHHYAQCDWTPRWTGEFTLKVKNCTSGDVSYLLTTN